MGMAQGVGEDRKDRSGKGLDRYRDIVAITLRR
jgi:hypothetical protein